MTINNICLTGGQDAAPRVVEYLADTGSTIVPGDLLERDNATEVSEHGTAGANTPPLFALPNLPVGAGIDTAYAAGDTCRAGYFKSGTEVYARVAASAAAIALGDALQSAGDGTLQKHTPQAVDEAGAATFTSYVDGIVAYAQEAVDNSGGGTVVRIKALIA